MNICFILFIYLFIYGSSAGDLGQEDPLEKRMATQSQYSCLENPMGGEAWWATVHGVAKSRT